MGRIRASGEAEAIRCKFFAAMDASGFPPGVAIKSIGCTRTTYYKWKAGGGISADYLPVVAKCLDVLTMGLGLGILPVPDRKVDTLYKLFYSAMIRLQEALAKAKDKS
jgi:hypothetical protein